MSLLKCFFFLYLWIFKLFLFLFIIFFFFSLRCFQAVFTHGLLQILVHGAGWVLSLIYVWLSCNCVLIFLFFFYFYVENFFCEWSLEKLCALPFS